MPRRNIDNQLDSPSGFAYDLAGGLTAEPTGGIYAGDAVGYDAERRLAEVTSGATKIANIYDGAGLRAEKTPESGSSVFFLYDAVSGEPLVEEGYSGGSASIEFVNVFGPDGWRERFSGASSSGNGEIAYAFDPQGSVENRYNASDQSLTADHMPATDVLVWDGYGLCLNDQWGKIAPEAYDYQYAYDTAGFDTGSTTAYGSLPYTDDFALGSTYFMTALTVPTTIYGSGGTLDFTANMDSQLGNTGFAFDGNGNPTTYDGAAFAFDAENRLTGISSPSFSAGYSGDGTRAFKSTPTEGATYFVYDADGNPLVEEDAAGDILYSNLFGADGWRARTLFENPAGFNAFSYDPQGNLVGETISDEVTPGLYQCLYDPYGKLLGQYHLTTGSQATPSGPVAFGGQYGYYTDTETGLLLLGSRYYDPGTGRFLNRDPIGYSGGENLYNAFGGNPVNEADPSGDIVRGPSTPLGKKYWAEALAYLKHSRAFNAELAELQASKTVYQIRPFNMETMGSQLDDFDYEHKIKYINWDPTGAVMVVDDSGRWTGAMMTAALVLAHELGHAYDYDTNRPAFFRRLRASLPPPSEYTDEEEQWDIRHTERIVANQLNAAKALTGGLTEGIRHNHQGRFWAVSGPTEFDYNGQFPVGLLER